jgi:hypothetical protein
MREIYFRAKPCYMGGKQPSWVYGTFQYIAQRRVSPGATDNGTLEPRQDKGRITDIYGIETEVLCDTVCQFTGCLDKEKRRIYEGDIIECVSWNEYWTDGSGKPMEQMRRRMLVEFRHGSFVCVERQQAPFDDKVWNIISNQDCIIIGNRFDNPDLWPWSPFGQSVKSV